MNTAGRDCSHSTGDELEKHYRQTLEALGREQGMLGIILRKSQNKVSDPAKLRRLIDNLINPGDR